MAATDRNIPLPTEVKISCYRSFEDIVSPYSTMKMGMLGSSKDEYSTYCDVRYYVAEACFLNVSCVFGNRLVKT
jgi:hypothetical protein